MLPGLFANPSASGFDSSRLDGAFALLDRWTRNGTVPAAALCVGSKAGVVEPRFFGRMGPDRGAAEIRKDALFLVASITKPVTVAAVLMLIERGDIALDDYVVEYLPTFRQNGKQSVRVRHLMTHTSGLPDMPPNNSALRAAHAPLSRFVEEITTLPLAFAPGSKVSYQSAGIAILAEIVHQVSGLTISGFLRKNVFDPLGMTDTSLGWQPEKKERIAAIRLEPAQQATDWNWNTPYWLGFGAPWGGMITSPVDFARFCRMMLGGGELDGARILSPASVHAMTMNQLAAMPDVPEIERRCRPWGLGWRLNWQGHSANFGDLLGPRTYGHWGATGTLCWIDPDSQKFMILFTTQPGGDEGSQLARVANAVAAAIV